MNAEAKTTKAAGNAPFVLSRTFDAPRERVWRAYTEREHLMRWMGPAGMPVVEASIDLRPGGTFHYGMKMPDGSIIWGKWTFREIVAPERLVAEIAFSDRDGGLTRHPLAATWPLKTLATTTFSERDGKTTVTVEWASLDATETERKTFDDSHDGMRAGWSGTFDKLDAHLAKPA